MDFCYRANVEGASKKIEEFLSSLVPGEDDLHFESWKSTSCVFKLETERPAVGYFRSLADRFELNLEVDYETYSKQKAGRLLFEPNQDHYKHSSVSYAAYRYACDYIKGDDLVEFLCEVLFADTPYNELHKQTKEYVNSLIIQSDSWVDDWDLMCMINEKEIKYADND